MATKYN